MIGYVCRGAVSLAKSGCGGQMLRGIGESESGGREQRDSVMWFYFTYFSYWLLEVHAVMNFSQDELFWSNAFAPMCSPVNFHVCYLDNRKIQSGITIHFL